jgi:hypothetical protein
MPTNRPTHTWGKGCEWRCFSTKGVVTDIHIKKKKEPHSTPAKMNKKLTQSTSDIYNVNPKIINL